jgi:hypothetical protein
MKIRTTFVRASDSHGERIRARVRNGGHTRTITRGYDYALDGPGNHYEVAAELAKMLDESAYAATFNLERVGDHARGYDWEL